MKHVYLFLFYQLPCLLIVKVTEAAAIGDHRTHPPFRQEDTIHTGKPGHVACDHLWMPPTGICCNYGTGTYCSLGTYCDLHGCCEDGQVCRDGDSNRNPPGSLSVTLTSTVTPAATVEERRGAGGIAERSPSTTSSSSNNNESPENDHSSSSGQNNTGMVVGCAFAGALAFLAIPTIVILIGRRKRKKAEALRRAAEATRPTVPTGNNIVIPVASKVRKPGRTQQNARTTTDMANRGIFSQ